MRPRGVPKGVTVLSQCTDRIGDVEVTFTVGRIEKPELSESEKEKTRAIARLGRGMPGLVGR